MTLSSPQVVILDRDGVINRNSADYIKSPDEWVALPGSLEAIAELTRAGFGIGIATNQSGVGRGLFTIDTLWEMHQKMLAQILAVGGYVQKIFFCLHTPDDHCDCRKPKPGLLYQAAEYYACGFANMVFIGDSESDMLAAQSVGARFILVRTGNGALAEEKLGSNSGIEIFDDLAAAAAMLSAERNQAR